MLVRQRDNYYNKKKELLYKRIATVHKVNIIETRCDDTDNDSDHDSNPSYGTSSGTSSGNSSGNKSRDMTSSDSDDNTDLDINSSDPDDRSDIDSENDSGDDSKNNPQHMVGQELSPEDDSPNNSDNDGLDYPGSLVPTKGISESSDESNNIPIDKLFVTGLSNHATDVDKLHLFQIELSLPSDELFYRIPNSLKFKKHDDFLYCKSRRLGIWIIYIPGFWMFDKWFPNVEDVKLGTERVYDPESDVIVFTNRIDKLKDGNLEIYFESQDSDIHMTMDYDIKKFIDKELLEKLQKLKQKYSYSLKFIV